MSFQGDFTFQKLEGLYVCHHFLCYLKSQNTDLLYMYISENPKTTFKIILLVL